MNSFLGIQTFRPKKFEMKNRFDRMCKTHLGKIFARTTSKKKRKKQFKLI